MTTFRDWLADWRSIADAVPAGVYEPITITIDGREFEILRISAYDREIDGERRVVTTPVRQFDDKVALFTRRTRDLGLVRVIAVRGRPTYVLEPGGDALDWAAEVEGISSRTLLESVREGAIGRRVARLANRRERRSREVAEAQVQALQERLEDTRAEVGSLELMLRAQERILSRLPMD